MKKNIFTIAISILSLFNLNAQEELINEEIKSINEYHESAAKQKEALVKQSLAYPITLTANKEGYDVKYYSIDLEINPTTKKIAGSVLVQAEVVTDSLTIIDLDLMNNMKVDSITQNSSLLTFTHSQNLITINLSHIYYSKEIFEIRIKYSGTPSSSGGFMGTPFVFSSYNSKPMIYSTVTSARYWWPCKDFPVFPIEGYPYDKADSIDINISVPANLIVLSNGKLVNVIESGSNKIYQWQERYAILPMAVSLFIYPYQEYSDWFKYSEADSMQIKFYYFEDQYSKFYPYFSKTKEMLRFFSDLFGLYPYIKEKYGLALWSSPDYNMSAQNVTALIYFISTTRIEYLASHELSHQWWWYRNTNDVQHDWLSEGFADYSAALWGEYKYGSTYYNNFMNQQKYYGGGSIYWEDPISQNYDVNLIYLKGSWVIHMLRHVLGDSTFFNVLQAYATEPTYNDKLVTTEDFQKIAEEVSGLDLNAFFEQWIYKSGYPSYTYSYTSIKNAENNYDVNVTINQIGTIFQMPIDVTIQTATGNTTFVANVNQQTNTFQFTLSDEPNSVILDRDNWILCKINLLPTIYALSPSVDKSYARKNIDSILFRTEFSNILDHQFTPHVICTNLNSTQSDSLTLLDDGLHGDSLANDGVYGGYIPPRTAEDFYSLSLSTIDHQTNVNFNSPDILRFTTAGPVVLDSIRFVEGLTNFYNLRPFVRNEGSTLTISNAKIQLRCSDTWVSGIAGSITLPSIAPGGSVGASSWIAVSYYDSIFPGYFNLKAEISVDGWTYWTDSIRINVITGVEAEVAMPSAFKLEQNFPNPWNPVTTIGYILREKSNTKLTIINALGEEVAILVNEEQDKGYHKVEFDGAELSSGVYFYKLVANDFVSTKKMMLVK